LRAVWAGVLELDSQSFFLAPLIKQDIFSYINATNVIHYLSIFGFQLLEMID
jgi:hypothetical protein